MASIQRLTTKLISQLNSKPTASLIFLHGSGDTGDGIKQWITFTMGEFSFPHIRVIFPTAPSRPYTPNGGYPSTVWFDRQDISPSVAEHRDTLDPMCDLLGDIVQSEVQSGIPRERIVIGGFSMGAAMALHLAYRHFREVAGVIALSGFLNDNSAVYEVLKERGGRVPPLLQCHGQMDPLVKYSWGKETFRQLQSYGVRGEFESFPNLYHDLNEKELNIMKKTILTWLPES
ncbi:hypothetical protein ScPMuIL_013861 [Solemya velum]